MILIDKSEKIPAEYLNTTLQHLIEYHNLGYEFKEYEKPQLLIGTCMDYRINLRIPDRFAFVIRNGGASLKHNDFQMAFALSVGGCQAIAVIGHTDCGMVNLPSKHNLFVDGMTKRLNYEQSEADEFFRTKSIENEIYSEIEFTKKQAEQLKEKYPNIPVIAMIYEVKDNLLYHI